MYRLYFLCCVWIFSLVVSSGADVADVLDVSVECADTCTFSVTVLHDDQGWSHFANRYEILTLDGEILATRVLGHPHVEEQPFTRTLGGVVIPPDITRVKVRAHDLIHGYGGKEVEVDVPVVHDTIAELSIDQ